MSFSHDAGPEAAHETKRDALTHVPPRFPAPKSALRLLSSSALSSTQATMKIRQTIPFIPRIANR